MSDPLDGYRLCKVDDGYYYSKGDGSGFAPIRDAKPCVHPMLNAMDMITHTTAMHNRWFRVACGRTGCAAGGYAKSRGEAEKKCIENLETMSAKGKKPPAEILWFAIAEGIKRYGLSPRYAWHKEYKRRGS